MADVVIVCCTTTLRGPTDKHRSPQHILAWVTLNVHLLLVCCSPLMLSSVCIGLWSFVASHHVDVVLVITELVKQDRTALCHNLSCTSKRQSYAGDRAYPTVCVCHTGRAMDGP